MAKRYCEFCGSAAQADVQYGCCYFTADHGGGFTEPVEAPEFFTLNPDLRELLSLLMQRFQGAAAEEALAASLGWEKTKLRSFCHPEPEMVLGNAIEFCVSAKGPWPNDNHGALILPHRNYDDVTILTITEMGRASWSAR